MPISALRMDRCACASSALRLPPDTPRPRTGHSATAVGHRFVIANPATGAECTVEIFPDGGRLHRRITLDIGPALHPDDLAADKTLALWGRARARDFYDVAALLDRYSRDQLLDLAADNNTGFNTGTFIDALRAIARLAPADWTEDGIPATDIQRLNALFDEWRADLARTP